MAGDGSPCRRRRFRGDRRNRGFRVDGAGACGLEFFVRRRLTPETTCAHARGRSFAPGSTLAPRPATVRSNRVFGTSGPRGDPFRLARSARMKVYDTSDIRNVALVGHGDSGKTTLASAALYLAGATKELGSVPDGTAVTDFDEAEIERKVSMSLAVAAAEWKDRKINLIDAPGYPAFIGDAAGAFRAADLVTIVVHAVDGIGVQTERMWEEASRAGLPVMFVVSQLDRERADFDAVLEALRERFGRELTAISLPIGKEASFEGVVSLVDGRAYPAKAGARPADPPADMAESIEKAREKLFDQVAESDDALMEAYLEAGTLTPEQLAAGLARSIAARQMIPVFAASGANLGGVAVWLDAIAEFGPDPTTHPPLKAKRGEEEIEVRTDPSASLLGQVVKTYIDPFAGRISLIRLFGGAAKADQACFNPVTGSAEKLSGLAAPRGKTGEKIPEARAGDIVAAVKLKDTHTGDTLTGDKSDQTVIEPIPFPKPAISYALKTEGDEEKMSSGLQRLAEEDATLRLERDPRTHELMVAGLGVDHLRTILDKLERRFNVKATLEKPKIPYLETITKTAKAQYRHKKQTGGAGQFAEVHLRIEPLPRGAGFQYDSEIFGGAISRNFWPSIEKGIRQVLETGAIAGYPMVDVKAVVYDGKEHPVDSKDVAFQVAGRECFKLAVKEAGPVVLEPIMRVVVTCPDENMGDVLGDLNRRRGKVQGSDSQGGRATIRAEVPMAEMLEYNATLRSLTSGRGSFTMELAHYERVPAEIQQKLVAEFKPQADED
ncbi:MAG: elongation factor G [Acidobacteria bacterium]|nr:MAG: elongation factor G [Acidobacteriota bacterium]